MKKILGSVIALTVGSFLTACVTNPPVEETVVDGVLIAREFVQAARQSASDSTMGVMVGKGLFVPIPLYGPGPRVNWYRHDVRLADGSVVSVVAQGETHDVGDCVRIFRRAEGYVQRRITFGQNCLAKH